MAIRELIDADYPAVQTLHRSVGWPQRSLAGWRWLAADSTRHDIGAPAGWIVNGPDGAPAACLGNLIQRFTLGDRTLYGATGFSIIVTPTARGASRSLLHAFLEQRNVFVAYTLNANARSQPLYARYGMQAWPPATHATKLSWPVNRPVLAAGRLLRVLVRMAPDVAPHLGERLMNDRLGQAVRLNLSNGVAVLDDLRDQSRYAEFWQALKAEGRLLTDRSPTALRRRLEDPDLTTSPLILAFNRGRDITGYAMAMMAKANIIEAPVLEIVDLEALRDDPEAIPALMRALLDAARTMGAAKVRLQTVSPRMLTRLGDWAKSARREGGWGHCHVRFAPDAPDPGLWTPTPFDGDYGICLRPLPLVTATPRGARSGLEAMPSLA
jgi:hypothetical protein